MPLTTADGLGPVETAAAVAPIVDRLRMAMMNAVFGGGPPASFAASGLNPETGKLLAYLRNAWPDRSVPRSSVRAVFTYQPETPVDDLLDVLVGQGLIDEPEPGLLRVLPPGRHLLEELHLASSSAADSLWADALEHVAAAAPLVETALSAARATGGDSLQVMAPHRLPEAMSAAGVLAEQLTGLRFHRFDAHAAAWRHAGLEVRDLAAMDDALRESIEAETNVRASHPYTALTGAQRRLLVQHLEALPH